MKTGKKLPAKLAALRPVTVYVRTHNLLTSGDGTAGLKWSSTDASTDDKKGNPVYNWTIVNRIMDTYVVLGMRPIVEIGFMPEALSVKPKPTVMNFGSPQDVTDDQYSQLEKVGQ